MELKEFISTSLEQILQGIQAAQNTAGDMGALINPIGKFVIVDSRGNTLEKDFYFSEHIVEFDIAVSTSDSIETGRGVKVFLIPFGSELSGSDQSAENTVQRIKFTVPVYYPGQIDKDLSHSPKPLQNENPFEKMKNI